MIAEATWAWAMLQEPAAELAGELAKAGVSKGSEQVAKRAASVWQKLGWNDAENAYRQKLLTIVRSTKILGNPTPIDIDQIYTDVYVFDKLSAIRRYSETLDEDEVNVRDRLDDRDRIEATTVLANGKNTFILGRPGAGKTTFLKHLAMSACRGLKRQTPIFVSLKDWSDSTLPLLDFMSRQFDICQFPDSQLFLQAVFASGSALVLLDGLDEVNEWQDKRSQTIRDIVNFSNKYERNQFCLTCRTAATDYSFESFQYVEVADFTPAQQNRFAAQWYRSNNTMLTKFRTAWEDPRSSGFRELGKTPLLLALMCLSFDESHTFPKRQVDLYYEAINALLKKWDTSRLISRDNFYKDLSYGQRQQLLETVASHFYFESRTVFREAEIAEVCRKFLASLPDVEDSKDIDGPEIVRQIEAQHGLIVERARGLYTFSHLTVQEYFTASYISKNQNVNLQRQIVKSALNDQKWREVMLYTVALLPQADSVLEEMKRQLLAMKQVSGGVLVFLAHCYCTVRLTSSIRSDRDYYDALRLRIERYVEGLRQPSLTTVELTKFVEHIEVLDKFLKQRESRQGYEVSAGVVRAAARFLKMEPLDAARLLGGYFIKPEQFINYFYACRLFIECLEISITSTREKYLSEVLAIDDRDRQKVEEATRRAK